MPRSARPESPEFRRTGHSARSFRQLRPRSIASATRKRSEWRLGEGTIVIDRGDAWSPEMVDFNRPAACDYVVRELRTILQLTAFDEIFINTRSHTQLSASQADGEDGVRSMAYYRTRGRNYFHYGIDRAFGPVSLADQPGIRRLADDRSLG